MELWIRSQNKQNLMCCKKIIISDKDCEEGYKVYASKLVQMYEMREEAKHNNITVELYDDVFKLLDGEIDAKKFVTENINLITPILHSSGIYDGIEYLYTQTFIDFINEVF